MRKTSIIYAFLFVFIQTFICQDKQLRFNSNGEFKILQFTDLHINMHKGNSNIIFEGIKKIVELEKPDLVVLTGDIITQDSIDSVLKRLALIFVERKVLWASAFGNHDEEYSKLNSIDLAELYMSMPNNVNQYTEGIKGGTNYILPVKNKMNKNQALLYFFDSNGLSTMQDKVPGWYDWFGFSQIDWYRKQSAVFTAQNSGTPYPALAFFHIPFPEYNEVWQKDSLKCIGNKNEKVCSPSINSGMFTAMIECGDIMGTFVGHDHENDYIGVLYGIALAFGRFTGRQEDDTMGGRVIILKEGKREFETWIREKSGDILYQCQYPTSFIQGKK